MNEQLDARAIADHPDQHTQTERDWALKKFREWAEEDARCGAARWTGDVHRVCSLPKGHAGGHEDHREAVDTAAVWCWS